MKGQPSYEDVEPKSAEWKEEKTAHILKVHLPGFVKEQIRVTYDENSRSFNVQGDHPLGNNRFGHLNVDFTVPDNCKMKDMQGKFQDEVLTITIPKEYVSQFFVPKETTTSAQSPPEKPPSIAQKPPVISEPPKVPPQMPPPETAFSSATKKPERQPDFEKLTSPNGEPTGKSLDRKAAERPGEKVPGNGKETSDVPSTSLEKEMKRANDTDVAGESKSGADDARKKKRDAKAGEAEKQLLVNVCVTALVLVAFGAYVGYNFACLRSARE
ncbi:hypothetical protein NL676_004914 [Syzygium grande]|nr:hypothetical protein NL676_004914 [Syzygium grande]